MSSPLPNDHLVYVAFEDKKYPQSWRVEMIDYADGDCHSAIFNGPDRKARAVEYARWMNERS